MNPLNRLLSYEGTASTTEQKIYFPAERITKIVVTGTPNVSFGFDYSITADDNPYGLSYARKTLKELLDKYRAHCVFGMNEAYLLLTELRIKYIAHCAMGTGTHRAKDVVNNAPASIASSSLANMISAANDLKAKYNAHDAESATYHTATGTAHQTAASDATDLVTLIVLLTELRTDIIAHLAETDIHTAADATNTITSAAISAGVHVAQDATNNDPTLFTSEVATLTQMITSAKSLKTKYNAHDADDSLFHAAAGTAHQITASDPTTLPTLITLLIELLADFNAHCADAVAHSNADTTNVSIFADPFIGSMTLVQNETVLDFEIACQWIYFKAASSTSAFKIYGLSNDKYLVNA